MGRSATEGDPWVTVKYDVSSSFSRVGIKKSEVRVAADAQSTPSKNLWSRISSASALTMSLGGGC